MADDMSLAGLIPPPPTERQAWRRYFDVIDGDHADGIEPTAEERRNLLAMCRSGFVVWRCKALSTANAHFGGSLMSYFPFPSPTNT